MRSDGIYILCQLNSKFMQVHKYYDMYFYYDLHLFLPRRSRSTRNVTRCHTYLCNESRSNPHKEALNDPFFKIEISTTSLGRLDWRNRRHGRDLGTKEGLSFFFCTVSSGTFFIKRISYFGIPRPLFQLLPFYS